jgi:predicted unusual protein kinase regulating ubiquinone biosynthesis (AarF/ABC1/UbiB family)
MRVISSVLRVTHVCGAAFRHAAAHAVHAVLRRWPRLAVGIAGPHVPGPQRLRLAIQDMGGSFIKFGQMLAMQSDMLPLQYCQALFTLFDQVPPFSYFEVEQIFQEDLAHSPLNFFDSFDRIPIATGSIGQVHVATLGTSKVAVKIRRPTILRDLAADTAAMRLLVTLVKVLHIKWMYWIIAPTEEFIAWTQEELDFRREAHYIDELGRNARGNHFEKVPRVFWSCTTARILTAEFLDGMTVSEYLRWQDSNLPSAIADFNPDLYASRLIDNFLGDAFRFGLFHADLHPGNLVIMPGSVVGYIDFGISGVLSRYSRRHLIAMTLAYARGDLDKMCQSFFRISTFARNANVPGFRKGVSNASAAWYGNQRQQRRLRKSITAIMLDLLILSKENGVWPQRDVIKYIRSAIALDGLIKSLAPSVDVGRHLEQACARHIRWDSFSKLTSYDTFTGSIAGFTRLARDGFLRLSAALNQAARDKPDGLAGLYQKPGLAQLNRIAQFLWIILCNALLWMLGRKDLSGHFMSLSGLILQGATSVLLWQALQRSGRRIAGDR